jgi:hypothetical protein
MSPRRALPALLTIIALLAVATPARAGLLDGLGGLLGPPTSSGTDRAGGSDWTLGGRPCNLIPTPGLAEVPTAAPFAVGSCPGVRPGALVQTEGGSCTLNFMFTDPDGDRFMGTAGHCILATSPVGQQDNGEVTFAAGEGPEATDGEGNRIGEFVYAIQSDPKDFALIELDDDVEASPQVCGFGGPTGINDSQSGLEPTVLSNYGNPLGLGTGVTQKSFLALGMPDPDHVFATGLVLPGDSGGPVLDEAGRAVGVVVTTGLNLGDDSLLTGDGLDAGLVGITRLAPQLERAEDVLGTDFELVTAPRL